MPRRSPLVSAILLAVVLGAVLAAVPVPYVALVPGPTTNTLGRVGDKPLIQISGHRSYVDTGHLNLMTVGVVGGPGGSLTGFQAVRGWFSRDDAVLPEDVVFPAGSTAQQVEQENTQEMTSSQQSAITAALRRLKIPVTSSVVVAAVEKGLPSAGVLRAGDVLRAVNGRAVTSAARLRSLVSAAGTGARVQLSYTRKGASRTGSVTTVSSQGRPVLGVEVLERNSYPFTVAINLKDVGGPSAGLMFTLGIYDKLTPGSLTGGKFIAGTGTMADDGAVGPIGGIQQKMVAAKNAGAGWFLTPRGNCAAAEAARPSGLTLVEVASLGQALDRLAAIRAGRPVPGC